jgi:hypothetical protein
MSDDGKETGAEVRPEQGGFNHLATRSDVTGPEPTFSS